MTSQRFPVPEGFCQNLRRPRKKEEELIFRCQGRKKGWECADESGIVCTEAVIVEGAQPRTRDHAPQQRKATFTPVQHLYFYFPFLSSLRPALGRPGILCWEENIGLKGAEGLLIYF